MWPRCFVALRPSGGGATREAARMGRPCSRAHAIQLSPVRGVARLLRPGPRRCQPLRGPFSARPSQVEPWTDHAARRSHPLCGRAVFQWCRFRHRAVAPDDSGTKKPARLERPSRFRNWLRPTRQRSSVPARAPRWTSSPLSTRTLAHIPQKYTSATCPPARNAPAGATIGSGRVRKAPPPRAPAVPAASGPFAFGGPLAHGSAPRLRASGRGGRTFVVARGGISRALIPKAASVVGTTRCASSIVEVCSRSCMTIRLLVREPRTAYVPLSACIRPRR